MPYDLTCKWNLINKTNKQAKKSQRHGNKEETDSEQSWGRGIMGKGWGRVESRNRYKGPMAKDNGLEIVFGSRGWIGQARTTVGKMVTAVTEEQ